MFTAIFPEIWSITIFILSILSLQAGRSPGYMQNYPIMSVDTTALRHSFSQNTSVELPIYEVYKVFMTTTCEGYYASDRSPSLSNVTCSHPSLKCKSCTSLAPANAFYLKKVKNTQTNQCAANFRLGDLIAADLAAGHSNQTLTSLSFPAEIQRRFHEQYNLQLYVAAIFYVLALVWTGFVIVGGVAALAFGGFGLFMPLLTAVCCSRLPLLNEALADALCLTLARFDFPPHRLRYCHCGPERRLRSDQ